MKKQSDKTATMIDVAKSAGVSLKTVSRTLNKEEYVSEATREAVLAAATKLGYKLNQAARTLRSGNAQIFALLVDNPSGSYLQNTHFGALKKCQELSIQLILHECPNGVDDVRKLLQNISPSGFILSPPVCDNPHIIAFLQENKCDYVLIAPDDIETPQLSVTMDDTEAAREMTEYLFNLGHKQIGFVKGHPDHSSSKKRLEGFYQAHHNHNIKADEDLIELGYFDYASGLEAAEKLLDRKIRPTAIFSCNDDMAAAAIAAAYKRNISIPSDLTIVGFDDTPIASIISPHLTTIRQPIAELTANAVELLADHINHNYTDISEKKSVVMDHALVERDSSAPPRL